MSRLRALFLSLTVFAAFRANAVSGSDRFAEKVQPILARQCFQCHGSRVQTAGVDFSIFRDEQGAAEKTELWRKVAAKIQGHLMPPPPLPGLSATDAAELNGWIDSVIVPAQASGGPGRVTARRLNRVEFNKYGAGFPRSDGASGGRFPDR